MIYYMADDAPAPPTDPKEREEWLTTGWYCTSWSPEDGDNDDVACDVLHDSPVRERLDITSEEEWPLYLWVRSEAHGLTRHDIEKEYDVHPVTTDPGVKFPLPGLEDT